jgi:hypothetical protein
MKNESHIEEDRILMRYVVVNHRHNRIAAESDSVGVMYNNNERKKTAIPDEIQETDLGTGNDLAGGSNWYLQALADADQLSST